MRISSRLWRGFLIGSAALLLGACSDGDGGGEGPAPADATAVRPVSAPADGGPAEPVALTPQSTGTTASLRGIDVLDEATVWVAGTGGTVARSRDAGVTWERLEVPGAEELDFRDVELLDAETALVMSVGNGAASRIYKTADGGATWRVVYANTEEAAFFNGMAFWDARSGMLTSDSFDGKLFLLATADGGETWERVGEGTLPPLVDGEYGFAGSGTGIATAGAGDVWVATGGSVARIFHSGDRGGSWEVFATPMASGTESSGIFSVTFRDPGGPGGAVGVAVGGDYQDPDVDHGNVARTSDGGRTWALAETEGGVMPHKACVQYLGNGRYLAAGRTGIAHSADDGATWRILGTEPWYTIAYHEASGVGWLADSQGRVARFEVR